MTHHFDPNLSEESFSRTVFATYSPDTLSQLRSEIVRLAGVHKLSGNKKWAQTITHSVVKAVWHFVAAHHLSGKSIRPPYIEVKPTALPTDLVDVITEFAHLASKAPIVWTAFEIGQIYASLLPSSDRKSGGVYYTPPHIAHEMVGQAKRQQVDFLTDRILEPSAGGGVLLSAMLNEMLSCSNGYDGGLLPDLPSRFVGLEFDPFAAWLAQIAVDIQLLPIAMRYDHDLPKVVYVADTLQKTFEADFDVVLMNPPFGRTKLTPHQREKFARSLHGHANSYAMFVDQALRAVNVDGTVVALTPTSFLSGEYFKNLRFILRANSAIKHIGVFNGRSGVFEDVQQELALSTIRKTQSSRSTRVSQLHIDTFRDFAAQTPGEFELPDDVSALWIIPRTRNQATMAQDVARFTHRLNDWGYTIKTGPLIWNRFKSNISERPKPDSLPLIWASCIETDGAFSWPPDSRKDKAWIRLQEDRQHLLQSDPCILLQRTTSREQNRRLAAAPLPFSMINNLGAVAIENHIQILEPASNEPPVSMSALTAFLNSQTADIIFRCVSGSASVSAYELRALPLPDPKNLGRLEALVADAASPREIEREIQRLYREE